MASAIGIIGLGVMGTSLARNFGRNEIAVSIYNRHYPPNEIKVAEQRKAAYPELNHALAFEDLKSFVQSLELPRKVLLMVNAGDAVDAVVEDLIPFLNAGDIIIDAGNSLFSDTNLRQEKLEKNGIQFIGMGVSGGEKGALEGPSMMPGGKKEVYDLLSPLLEKIAARDFQNQSCCKWIGNGGSGHFVKMVHNGIEYAEMQLLAETYDLFRGASGFRPSEISSVFKEWQQNDLQSYLLEITAEILLVNEGEELLLDKILDVAGSKGTGTWTVIEAAKLGIPIPTISAALNARSMSGKKTERITFADKTKSKRFRFDFSIEELEAAYRTSRIINHHIGLDLIKNASDTYDWNIDLKSLASVWTNGCIIKSGLMEEIALHYENDNGLLFQDFFFKKVEKGINALRKIVSEAIFNGWSLPCFQASLDYYHSLSMAESAANMIQAQRDYFGAHTYKRNDKPLDENFHTDWEALKD
ncbi:MAG: NADP-dependent phosphogluconate dehydrogenase [Saprospiraceae bacterium]